MSKYSVRNLKKGDAKLKCSAISLAKSSVNLDRALVDEEDDVYAVMDGTTEGRQLSNDFVGVLEELVTVRMHRLVDVSASVESTIEEFESLVVDADVEIPETVSEQHDWILTSAHGVGSTLTLVRKTLSHWVTVNSGDSTAFLVREGEIIPLTYADTEWNRWIEDGLVEVVNGVAQCEISSNGLLEFARVAVDFLGYKQATRRMVRWIGDGGIPHTKAVPCKPGDVLVLWTDGVNHLVNWHASKRFLPDHEKIVQAVTLVVNGEADHLLAAFPVFWNNYLKNGNLADDTTALVVYEG